MNSLFTFLPGWRARLDHLSFALIGASGLILSPLQAAELPPPNSMLLSGKLKQGGVPSQGEHDFRFQLYDRETGGQVPPGAKDILVTKPVAAGDWQVVLDVRQFGTEKAILENNVHDASGLIRPPESYVGILDDTIRPPQGWTSILDDTIRPPMGSRSIMDNTVHTATALNWRASQGTWVQISVRKKGDSTFVPLSPRQRLTAVPGAIVAQTANHALVAGTVSEGGVDARALAPGIITQEKLTPGAVNNSALASLAVTAPKIAPLTVVRSVNGLQDEVTLAAGTGISLASAGNTITIHSTVTGGGGNPLPNGNFIGANNNNTFGPSVVNSVIAGGSLNSIVKAPENDLASGVTIAGGAENRAVGFSSTVGGGYQNNALHNGATVAGGANNNAGDGATVGGGFGNSALSVYTAVGAGRANKVDINSDGSGIAFGRDNSITNASDGTVSGGSANVIKNGYGGNIAGGAGNLVEGSFGTISGGSGNIAGPGSAVGGGTGNRADGTFAVVGGGNSNISDNSMNGTIAGGFSNSLTNGAHGIVGGGQGNGINNAIFAGILGGAGNTASSSYSAILGGEGNRTEGIGGYATVLGGSFNIASGTHSIAAGHRAHAIHSGSFVWNAWPGDVFPSVRDYEFAIKAPGGVRLETGGAGLFVDGQRISSGAAGNGPITVITAGGQTEPQARLDQTNPDDYVRLMMNTPRSFWTLGTGPNGWFSFYVPGQSPANTADSGGNRFVITANGEVGVGSQQPFGQLHVRGQGGFDLPQGRFTQENANDFARLRLETGPRAWDIAAGPDGSLRFFGYGSDRMILSRDSVHIAAGQGGLLVNGRPVAYADQLGQGGNGGPVSATVAQGAAITGTSEDPQAGVGLVATARVAVRAISSSAQGTAVQAVHLNGGYAGDFAGKVKVSSSIEANGGVKVRGAISVPELGDNTATAAFRLIPELLPVVSLAVPGSHPTQLAMIDHPSLNGNPNALLTLTPVNSTAMQLYQRSSEVMRGDFLIYYPDTPEHPASMRGRWHIDITRTPVGGPDTRPMAVFNALIITP